MTCVSMRLLILLFRSFSCFVDDFRNHQLHHCLRASQYGLGIGIIIQHC